MRSQDQQARTRFSNFHARFVACLSVHKAVRVRPNVCPSLLPILSLGSSCYFACSQKKAPSHAPRLEYDLQSYVPVKPKQSQSPTNTTSPPSIASPSQPSDSTPQRQRRHPVRHSANPSQIRSVSIRLGCKSMQCDLLGRALNASIRH